MMYFSTAGLIKIGAALVCLGIGLGSTFILKQKPDNPIEQTMEHIIKEETGIDIDLSPNINGRPER